MKHAIPFFASDISELAKSIKKQASNDSIELKQTQILGYLAKFSGVQNYQSYLAKVQDGEINPIADFDEVFNACIELGNAGDHQGALALIAQVATIRRNLITKSGLSDATTIPELSVSESSSTGLKHSKSLLQQSSSYEDHLVVLFGLLGVNKKSEFADKFVAAFRSKGLRVKDIADLTGVSAAAVALWGSGEALPKEKQLLRIIEWLEANT